MRNKRRLLFVPFFVLNAFPILIFVTALFQFEHFTLYMGYASVLCAYFISFTNIGFISHVRTRQVS